MITLHTGKLGAGKSYWATRDVWKKIKQGVDCYVNWKIDFTDLYLHEYTGWQGFVRKWWAKLTFGNEKFGKVYYWHELKDFYGLRNG